MTADKGGDDALTALVFDEAVRSLRDQATALDGLRARTGLLLSAAALVTSFLTAVALGQESADLTAWGWVATGAFLLVAVLAVAILWPRYRWLFTANPRSLVRFYLDAEDVDAPRARRNLAIYMGRAYEDNKEKLERLYLLFETACVVLAFEIVAWIIVIVEG